MPPESRVSRTVLDRLSESDFDFFVHAENPEYRHCNAEFSCRSPRCLTSPQALSRDRVADSVSCFVRQRGFWNSFRDLLVVLVGHAKTKKGKQPENIRRIGRRGSKSLLQFPDVLF